MACIHERHEKITWQAAWEGGEPIMICSKGNKHGMLSPQFGIYEVAVAFYNLGKPVEEAKCGTYYQLTSGGSPLQCALVKGHPGSCQVTICHATQFSKGTVFELHLLKEDPEFDDIPDKNNQS